MGRIVGIDFGTATTLVSERSEGGSSRIVTIGNALPWLPSVVGLDDDGRLQVGEDAVRLGPSRSIRSAKSALTDGTAFVRSSAGDEVAVEAAIEGLLREAIDRAEHEVAGLFDGAKVYLGCPALWTGTERRLLADVAERLGLDVDIADIIDEPVAAGLAWVNSRWQTTGEHPTGQVVIVDAGGGTLDVALLDVQGDDTPEITVLSAEGLSEAGDALDRSIADELRNLIAGLDDQELAEALLYDRARDLKEELSRVVERRLPLGGDLPVVLDYDRARLEAAFDAQLHRAVRLVKSVVRGAELRRLLKTSPRDIRQKPWESFSQDIEHVVLVGGLSQTPAVGLAMEEWFPQARIELVDRPQEAVALGLAHGDQLFRLNLPRPPVNFCIRYTTAEGRELPDVLSSWAADDRNRVIYPAYRPLYQPFQALSGDENLGFGVDVPLPCGPHTRLIATLYCEAPDRARTPFRFSVRSSGAVVDEGYGISVAHQGHRPARFKLYVDGRIVLTGSEGEEVKARIEHWPTLRSKDHDWAGEVALTAEDNRPWISTMVYDDWRFQ